MEKLKNNDALLKLKEELNTEVETTTKVYENDEKIQEYSSMTFTIKPKKKNVTDGTVQATFYLPKNQKNYIDQMSKKTGYNKSEFLQHIINFAMQNMQIE